jgi:predicted  nucleic acid-binding Zn-ribbon protein
MSAHSGGFWECEECGYSKWHYASEFADGASGDMRRICADCGHLHGATSEERESAPLVDGCNLEACLTYARERIAALESERDALQAKVSSALAAIERWMALGHAPAVTADLRARLETEESAEDQS